MAEPVVSASEAVSEAVSVPVCEPPKAKFCVADGYFKVVKVLSADSSGSIGASVFKAVLDCDADDAGALYGFRMTVTVDEEPSTPSIFGEKILLSGPSIVSMSVFPRRPVFHMFFETPAELMALVGKQIKVCSVPFPIGATETICQHTVTAEDCAVRQACGDTSTCCVCLNPMQVGPRTTKTFDCGHSVHSGCVPPPNYYWEYQFMSPMYSFIAAPLQQHAPQAAAPGATQAASPTQAATQAAPDGVPGQPQAQGQAQPQPPPQIPSDGTGTWLRDVRCPLCRKVHVYYVAHAPDLSVDRVHADNDRYYGSIDPIQAEGGDDDGEGGEYVDGDSDSSSSSSDDEFNELVHNLHELASANSIQLYYLRRQSRAIREEMRFMRQELEYMRSLMEDQNGEEGDARSEGRSVRRRLN